MKFYRVKKLSNDTFIPQVKTWLFGHWKGIDDNFLTWENFFLQKYYCSSRTRQEARQTIKKYKNARKKIHNPK